MAFLKHFVNGDEGFESLNFIGEYWLPRLEISFILEGLSYVCSMHELRAEPLSCHDCERQVFRHCAQKLRSIRGQHVRA